MDMLRCSGGSVRSELEITREPTRISPSRTDPDLALSRLDEARDQAERRGLAAAGRPQQTD
jgi:hypothetical protein